MNAKHINNQVIKKDEEQEGVKAIIALQKSAGITETEEQARRGWKSMTPHQREQTLLAFKIVCGGKA